MDLPSGAFRPVEGGTLLRCRVQPGASRSAVVGSYGDDCVKIALSSPPVDGKANRELCRMLAELCKVPKAGVELISGQASRGKVIKVTGISPEELRVFLSGDRK